MMTIVKGNVLDSNADAILHQVNCQGVMGSGLAKEIKERYPVVFHEYKALCDRFKSVSIANQNPLLGNIQIVYKENYNVNDVKDKQVVVNLFAQDKYGYSGRCYTDYDALRKCLSAVNKMFRGKNIAVPYGMSCGRGGADWEIVSKMIEKELKDCNIMLYKL